MTYTDAARQIEKLTAQVGVLEAAMEEANKRATEAEATLGRQSVQLDRVATSWSRTVDRATRLRERIEKLHQPIPSDTRWCAGCGQAAPCATLAVLTEEDV